jgi:Protein of unknown function (DUF3562)
VKVLYEEEVAALTAGATVRQFISVIATKRVKQQLRLLGKAELELPRADPAIRSEDS